MGPTLEDPSQPGPRLVTILSRRRQRLGLDEEQHVQQSGEAPEIGHLVSFGLSRVLHRPLVRQAGRGQVATEQFQGPSHDMGVQVGIRAEQSPCPGKIAGQNIPFSNMVDADLQSGSIEGIALGQHFGPCVGEDGALQIEVVYGRSQDAIQQIVTIRPGEFDVFGSERIAADLKQHVDQRLHALVLLAKLGQAIQRTVIGFLQGQKRIPAGVRERLETLPAPPIFPGIERQLRRHGFSQTVSETTQIAPGPGDLDRIGTDVGGTLGRIATALDNPTFLSKHPNGRSKLHRGNC